MKARLALAAALATIAVLASAGAARADPILPGAACTNSGTNSNSNYGILSCVGGVLVANPVVIGTTSVTCSSTYLGMERYNTSANRAEYCNGSAWTPFSGSGSGTYPGTCFGSPGTDTSLASGLVAYWGFDEDTGTVVDDYTGNSNSGDWQGTLGNQWTSGKISYGGNFDGSTNYVNTPDNPNTSFASGTISAWIKTSNTAGAYQGIAVKQSAYGMFLYSGQLVIYDWGANTAHSSGVTVSDGNWHFVAITFQSGVTNGSEFYVDGVAKAAFTMTINSQGSAFLLGSGGTSQQYFTGRIDEVGVWNVVLTAAQIASLYNSGSGNAYGATVCPSSESTGGFVH